MVSRWLGEKSNRNDKSSLAAVIAFGTGEHAKYLREHVCNHA